VSAGAPARLTLPSPIAELIGCHITERGAGRGVVELDADTRHTNPMGTLHGGVLCDIADLAMGVAYASTLGPDETFTTLELKINFLKPVWRGHLRAVAQVKRRGRTVGLVTCDILDERGESVAYLTSTCMTLRGAQATGR
jgi:uncharacterized protein (TIGR00369 family)